MGRSLDSAGLLGAEQHARSLASLQRTPERCRGSHKGPHRRGMRWVCRVTPWGAPRAYEPRPGSLTRMSSLRCPLRQECSALDLVMRQVCTEPLSSQARLWRQTASCAASEQAVELPIPAAHVQLSVPVSICMRS